MIDDHDDVAFRRYVLDLDIPLDRVRVACAACAPNRKKPNERSLSVDLKDDGSRLFYCHHAGTGGSILPDDLDGAGWRPTESTVRKEEVILEQVAELSEGQIQYLAGRGIGLDTVRHFGLVSGMVFIRERGVDRKGETVSCIGFPYANPDGSSAFKWRDGLKHFTQTGTCASLWKIDQFSGGDLVIVEGEMDAMSLHEAGVNAYSVPNGAPSAAIRDDGVSSKKFSYLWASKEILESADRIIISTDADNPGRVLADEIARRLGKARCWSVRYPDGCKDANDVLVRHGKDALRKCIDEATPWPIGGLRGASEYKDAALDLYRSGMNKGVEIKDGNLDRLFRPCGGTLTVCTGIPGSGKSSFLTWLSVKLAEQHGWSAAVFSAETSSQIHLLNIAAIKCQKPIRGEGRMTEAELVNAIDWASDHFVFLDEAETSIESVVERGQAAVLRNGVRLLVVDPYNWITLSDRDGEGSMVNSINQMLVKLKSFAVAHDIAVWLVAHPTKMYRSEGGRVPTPTGYDVSGSSAFFNVADNGLTVSRLLDGKCMITSWKARFPWLGSLGAGEIQYEPRTGVFSTVQEWGDNPADFEVDVLDEV